MADIINFEEAFQKAKSCKGNTHIILGNGFSMAYDPDIFGYGSLYEKVQDKMSDQLKSLFGDSKDFEKVIRELTAGVNTLEKYNGDAELIKKIKEDILKLKNFLVEALTSSHPSDPSVVGEDKLLSCARFLAKFQTVYTLNYDLLIYWAIIHGLKNKIGKYTDGFHADENDDEIIWDITQNNKPSINYLHGALHLFDRSQGLTKITWNRTLTPLREQIEDCLKKDEFPLIVAEGTSQEKHHKIRHFAYLERGIKSLSGIGGCLFIYGHSLDANDNHILGAIKKVKYLFISIFRKDEKTIKLAYALADRLKISHENLYFYDAESTPIWNNNTIDSKIN